MLERCDKLAIQPSKDKGIIRERILSDTYILSLGFSNNDTYNTNTTDEKLESGKKQIFIYNAPSRDNYSNSATVETLVQIDISAPVDHASKADLCAEQIIALMQDYDLGNGSLVSIVSPSPVAIACQSGFYCVGIRLSYYTSKYNEIKTI